jgi:hypothetical protein
MRLLCERFSRAPKSASITFHNTQLPEILAIVTFADCRPTRCFGLHFGLELEQRNPTVITLWHAAQALDVEVHLLLKKSATASTS